MAQVYWIHKAEHTDIFTQGYVGFTSRNLDARFEEHNAEANAENRRKDVIHKAILKYGDTLVKEVVVECDEEYGLYIEEKLRPHRGIGWNIAKGGGKPPDATGVKRTIEQVMAQSLRMKASGVRPPQTPEVKNKIRQTRLAKGLWTNTDPVDPVDFWRNADLMYNLFSRFPKIERMLLCHLSGVRYSRTLHDMLKHFKTGRLIPLENEQWLTDFTPNDSKYIDSLNEDDIFVMTQHYTHNMANRLWLVADEVRAFIEANPQMTAFGVNKHYGLPSKSINLLYKKIKLGWKPSEDKLYLAWLAEYNKHKECPNGT